MSRRGWARAAAAGVLGMGLWAAGPAGASTGWVIQHAPRPGGALGSLDGVSCSSGPVCTAVGYALHRFAPGTPPVAVPLAERKVAGSPWVIQSAPDPDGPSGDSLSAVSCPSATACMAAGGAGNADAGVGLLAESWDGTSWTVQDPAGPAGAVFSAVSCSSANSCTAVGEDNVLDPNGNTATLAEHWDGASWTVQHTPNPPGGTFVQLVAVSCSSATACTAIGSYEAGTSFGGLVERWNGTTWTIQPTPTLSRDSEVSGVSCPTDTSCTMVGTRGTLTGNAPLAEHWDGTTWTIQHAANPHGASDVALNAVSCPTAVNCTAVGASFGESSATSLAEHWDGTSWTIQPTPSPGGTDVQPLAVSCPTAAACTATGFWNDMSFSVPQGHLLAEHD